MSIIPVTVPAKKLAQTISSSDVAFKANNVLSWEGIDLVPADFGTEAYAVFTNSLRTQIEIIKFDPATIGDDSITILARGLGYSGSDVEDSSRKFPWASNDTTIQFGTDAPQLFRDFLSASNTATIVALHEYDVLPRSTVTPTDDEEFTTKSYVDGLTSPAITVPINQTTHGLVVGDAIKILGVNTFEKAQADSPANAEVVGYVISVADVDNFTYITEGIITTGVPVEAAGTVMFLDPAVAGGLTATETTTIGEVNMPLAIINESGVRMTFHKYRPLANNTIAGNPIASETVAGTVQEATDAQVIAKTDVGDTGAKLFVPPSKLPAGGFELRTSDLAATSENAGKTWMRTDLLTEQLRIVVTAPVYTYGVWASAATISTAEQYTAGAGTITAGLLFGGSDSTYSLKTFEYDGSVWTSGGNLTSGYQHLAGCGTQDAALKVGGFNGGYIKDCQKYNGASWASTGNLLVGTGYSAAFGTQTSAVIVAGATTGGVTASCLKFDGSVWSATGALSQVESELAAFGTTISGVKAGGSTGGATDVAESYNGTSWSVIATLGAARRSAKGSGLFGYGMVHGGSVSSTVVGTSEIFDGSSWSVNANNMAAARAHHANGGLEDGVLAAGGRSAGGSQMNSAEKVVAASNPGAHKIVIFNTTEA